MKRHFSSWSLVGRALSLLNRANPNPALLTYEQLEIVFPVVKLCLQHFTFGGMKQEMTRGESFLDYYDRMPSLIGSSQQNNFVSVSDGSSRCHE